MKSLKSVFAIVAALGLLTATGCSYHTCPTYSKYTPKDNGPVVASQQPVGK